MAKDRSLGGSFAKLKLIAVKLFEVLLSTCFIHLYILLMIIKPIYLLILTIS